MSEHSDKSANPSSLRPAVIIGGGVGPMAGVLLHQAIIRSTHGTERDADHLDVWHISDVSTMPDRTRFLLGEEQCNPGLVMAENVAAIGSVLHARGQDWITAVPCATFHAPEIVGTFNAALAGLPGYRGTIHLVDVTIEHIRSLPGDVQRVGVLSTQGSHRMGVWREPLAAAGFEVLEVSPEDAVEVHAAIYDPAYGLKAVQPPTGRAQADIIRHARALQERGAQALVLGCTELPFVERGIVEALSEGVVCNPTKLLARRAVMLCGA